MVERTLEGYMVMKTKNTIRKVFRFDGMPGKRFANKHKVPKGTRVYNTKREAEEAKKKRTTKRRKKVVYYDSDDDEWYYYYRPYYYRRTYRYPYDRPYASDYHKKSYAGYSKNIPCWRRTSRECGSDPQCEWTGVHCRQGNANAQGPKNWQDA